jgi:hypothetical protein
VGGGSIATSDREIGFKIELIGSRSSVKHGSRISGAIPMFRPRHDDGQRVQLSSTDQLESLILAQNERWRQA